jgi:hypothetical protein
VTAGDWATLIVAIASLLVGLATLPSTANRNVLVPLCVALVVIALGIGFRNWIVPANPIFPANPEVRHRGRINLEPGQSANLDAPQSSADWKYNDGAADEIRYSPGTGLTMGSGEIVTLGQREADFASCLNASGYTRRSFEYAYLIVGDYFCVKTSEQRIAAFRLIGVRQDLFTIDVITYEPQI